MKATGRGCKLTAPDPSADMEASLVEHTKRVQRRNVGRRLRSHATSCEGLQAPFNIAISFVLERAAPRFGKTSSDSSETGLLQSTKSLCTVIGQDVLRYLLRLSESASSSSCLI